VQIGQDDPLEQLSTQIDALESPPKDLVRHREEAWMRVVRTGRELHTKSPNRGEFDTGFRSTSHTMVYILGTLASIYQESVRLGRSLNGRKIMFERAIETQHEAVEKSLMKKGLIENLKMQYHRSAFLVILTELYENRRCCTT
jgi:hypothetical protein